MMSSGHAISGAAAGYTTCLTYSLTIGAELPWWFPHIAAGIVAGWALWPDCDTQKATVTTSMGFITRALHELVCHIAAITYYATRTDKDPADKPRIHRGITHTWPGALVMGVLVAVLCLIWPRYAEPAVLGISLHWAMRGLSIPRAAHGVPKGNAAARFVTTHAFTALRIVPMPGKVFDRSVRYASRKWFGLSGKWVRTSSLVICLVLAFMVINDTPELHQLGYILALGGLATEGCLVHCLGDSVTESGICWRFPFVHPVSGKRWHESKIPVIVWRGKAYKPAFKTGRAFEIAIMYPVLLFACVLTAPGGWALLGHMGEIGTAWRHTAALSAALTLSPWPTTKPASPRTTLLAQ